MKMRIALLSAVLALALRPVHATPPPPTVTGVKIQAFNVNTTMILEMYNQAQQYNGNVSSYPANLDPAVVTATMSNPTGASITPCFVLTVKDPNTSCGNQTIVTSPLFTAKAPLAPGETRVFTAADFVASGSYQGVFCQAAEDELKNEFGDTDPSQLNKVVDKFLKRKFVVCLNEGGCNNGQAVAGGQQACSTITLFTPNPGALDTAAVLIYPHNNAVPDCAVNFLWTPAASQGLSPSDISYVLDISEQMDGASFTRIEVPAGQTFYQYGAKDPVLTPGHQYYWRVISRNAKTHKNIGGQDGSGWNIQKWFRCGGDQQGNASCRYTLADFDALVQKRATQEVKDALAGMHAVRLVDPQAFNDPDVCKLLSRESDLKAINVTKK